MTDLATKDLPTLIEDQATAIQALCQKILDFTTGSVELSLIESNAAVAFWLQDLIVKLLSATRLITCVTDEDVESFVFDFGLFRLPAVAATGNCDFSRSIATQQAIVPVGAQVQSLIGGQTFTVYADPDNIYYDVLLNGYVLAPSTFTIPVPVRANVVGTIAGNVAANTITAIVQGISGVSNVNNPLAFTNGLDAETNPALKARFVLYIQSLSRATLQALEFAVASVQQGLTYKFVENKTILGDDQPGFFYNVFDDGSGMPNPDLTTKVMSAIEATRGFTIAYTVYAPDIVSITVSVQITAKPASDHVAITSAIKNKVAAYINSLGFGALLPYTVLAKLIYESSTDILNATSILLNGATIDLQAGNIQEFNILASAITVTYT